ncbi:MAG: MoxR family ATPase [Planctomycetota bacterium]
MGPEDIRDVVERLRAQLHRVVVGQDNVVSLLLIALLSEGHVLIEGVPGTAKTLLAQTFAKSLSLTFRRIQFTPDLMPGDVIGTNLFNFQTGKFSLTKGPIFTEVLLADEINRTPPKTQAALLQAMQERSVTIDGTTHDLGAGFMVLATQNPIEQEGTYPLPEAQLDRFLVKIGMGYPTRDEEREIVNRHGHRTAMPRLDQFDLEPVVDLSFLEEARAVVASIRLADEVMDYVVDVVRATREDGALSFGASPRSSNMLAVAARALAVLSGRDYVIPDDVKMLARPVLGHRVVLSPDAHVEGVTAAAAVTRILENVPAPR